MTRRMSVEAMAAAAVLDSWQRETDEDRAAREAAPVFRAYRVRYNVHRYGDCSDPAQVRVRTVIRASADDARELVRESETIGRARVGGTYRYVGTVHAAEVVE